MSREAFEAWWSATGQFHRAGGGEYEKTFAFHAWQAAQADAYERAAKLCHHMSIERSGMGYSGRTCSIRNQRAAECREAIRALAKETT